jgi:hypothetical protein
VQWMWKRTLVTLRLATSIHRTFFNKSCFNLPPNGALYFSVMTRKWTNHSCNCLLVCFSK